MEESLERLKEQFRGLKDTEGRKDHFIENLLIRVGELEGSLTKKKQHLEREQVTATHYQSKLQEAEIKLRRREEEIDSNSFVSVLIDGDCMTFLDQFVKSAQQGGAEAVCHLRSTVYEYLSTKLELPSHIQIRICIYANMKGLASTYCNNKILNCAEDLHTFVRGFNMGHPMCDFVDAGDGKECADSKLKAWFNVNMADVQCQGVFFGGSPDNGYARLLQPYVGDDSKSKRIILIEGPPFARELAALKDKFLVAHFPDVFRNTKLETRRVSFSTTPPLTPAPTYATTIKRPVDAATVKIEDAYEPSVAVPARKKYPVLQNRKGQRYDAVINPPKPLVNVMRTTKHCNMFHLLGECPYTKCNFLHGIRLDEKEIEARRLLLRHTPCASGLQCKDEKCLDGHQCPDRICAKVGRGCGFTVEMHNVDKP